jgi:hypothetical protein
MTMPTKFLITPKRKNSLVNQQNYKKDGESFCIESKWQQAEILVDKRPRSRFIDGKKVTTFKELGFKSNEYDYKTKLVFLNEVSDDNKKIVRHEYKQRNVYSLIELGWKHTKSIFTLDGDFDIQQVPVHSLTLFASELEGLVMGISKEKFEEYKSNGMSFEDYLEFDGESEYCSPIFDELTSLSIDDIELPEFQKLFKDKYSIAVKTYELQYPHSDHKLKKKKIKKTDLTYAVISERWIKRSWYVLTIYEEFDFSKLQVNLTRDYHPFRNTYVETFNLAYGEKDFEFLENFGANSQEDYLMCSDGTVEDFEVLEENHHDDDENDN